jgi:hypothetical protein
MTRLGTCTRCASRIVAGNYKLALGIDISQCHCRNAHMLVIKKAVRFWLSLVLFCYRESPAVGILDIRLHFIAIPSNGTHKVFNPSVINYGSRYLALVRRTQLYQADGLDWWANEAFFCTSSNVTFEDARCIQWDPRQDPGRECMWTAGRRRSTETLGIEDGKLFEWPSVGQCLVMHFV